MEPGDKTWKNVKLRQDDRDIYVGKLKPGEAVLASWAIRIETG